jgi:hypothetical protein
MGLDFTTDFENNNILVTKLGANLRSIGNFNTRALRACVQ